MKVSDDRSDPRAWLRPSPSQRWGAKIGYLWALLLVAGVTAAGLAVDRVLDVNNIALLYLLPVMAAASQFGLWPGLFAGLISSLAFNFFFLKPTGTLTISDPRNALTVVVLLGVAFVVSQLAARVRMQADLASSSARANAALAGFLGQLSKTASEPELAAAICGEIAVLFDLRAVLLTRGGDGPHLLAAVPATDRLGMIEQAAAAWALDHGVPAGRGSDTLTASDWLFQPLSSARETLAVLGLSRDDGRTPIAADQMPLLMSLLDPAAIALERARLAGAMQEMAQLKERDRLRAALLSSVSHDLRTPLTAILAATAALRTTPSPALIADIETETERLNRFVANLLDMARVEAGALKLRVEATDLADAATQALHDVRRAMEGHRVDLALPGDVPLVRVDPQLLHHILINLLDNAGRYAGPETPIAIRADRTADGLALSVLDEGPGLPPGREVEVFETFRRIEGSDRSKGGTGLGLAIVKGFAEAMGLGVSASNRADGHGACFTIGFPAALLVEAGDLGGDG